jgi:prepilin-type N-terminal cleavage/methylation domain-containing protein
MKKQQSGYSLVEVLIALAITSIVLLTVVTLFYMGKRNIYSGKQQTYAVSVGTRILEDLSSMTTNDIINNFNITDAGTTLTTVTVNQVPYTNSATVDTSSCTVNGAPPPAFTCTNDTGGYLSSWNSLIDQTKLQDAQIGLILTPTNPVDATKKWTTAQFLKTRIYIKWNEASRQRYAYFDTMTVNRQ